MTETAGTTIKQECERNIYMSFLSQRHKSFLYAKCASVDTPNRAYAIVHSNVITISVFYHSTYYCYYEFK